MSFPPVHWTPSHNGDDDDETEAVVRAVLKCMEYYVKFLYKEPRWTSILTGAAWMQEIMNGHPMQCQIAFGMSKEVFVMLCHDLVQRYALQVSERMHHQEQIGIFMYVLTNGASNRQTQMRFQHSEKTISRHFNLVLQCVLRMASDIIRPMDPQFVNPSSILHGNSRYWPYFKDAIGVIDGTHVRVTVNDRDKPRYIGCYGYPTTNILTACSSDMQFIYVMAGWEGSAHNTQILDSAQRTCNAFPHPPPGKYYIVDKRYPDITGYLRPYIGTRYYLSEFQQGGPPQGLKETFNYFHSSLRTTIKQIFGVWKSRWAILQSMPQFDVTMQVKIAVASMAVHNYIVRAEQGLQPCIVSCNRHRTEGASSQVSGNDTSMESVRAAIAAQLLAETDA